MGCDCRTTQGGKHSAWGIGLVAKDHKCQFIFVSERLKNSFALIRCCIQRLRVMGGFDENTAGGR